MRQTILIREISGERKLHLVTVGPIPIDSIAVFGSESGPLVTEWTCLEGWRSEFNWLHKFMRYAKPNHTGEYQVVMVGAVEVSKAWYDKEHNTWRMGRNVVPVELIACWRGCTIPFCPEG